MRSKKFIRCTSFFTAGTAAVRNIIYHEAGTVAAPFTHPTLQERLKNLWLQRKKVKLLPYQSHYITDSPAALQTMAVFTKSRGFEQADLHLHELRPANADEVCLRRRNPNADLLVIGEAPGAERISRANRLWDVRDNVK